jgi:hypothetical protein
MTDPAECVGARLGVNPAGGYIVVLVRADGEECAIECTSAEGAALLLSEMAPPSSALHSLIADLMIAAPTLH